MPPRLFAIDLAQAAVGLVERSLRFHSGSDPVVERSRNHCIHRISPVPLLFSSYASPYPLPILSLSSP
ncbi:MAG: hypothetical protein LWX70_10185, partial [Sphingobacteriia bacterium]|nr:hypothetical protein [Sphingobacteriia bacterium]